MSTLTKDLRSLPDKHRALLLLGVLIDSENIENIIAIDEKASISLAPLVKKIFSLPDPVRRAFVLTSLKESFLALNSIEEKNNIEE